MVGESAGGRASPESGPRAHTCRRVENNVGEENGVWRRVADLLMPDFLPASRLGPNAPNGGVASRSWSNGRKNLSEKFLGR